MFKLNLKIAWRNLLKNKFYTLFNVFGLGIGLAGTLIILIYVKRETGFDQWNKDLKRTYMVAADYVQNGTRFKGSKIKHQFAELVKQQFPEVEVVSIGNFNGGSVKLRKEGQLIEDQITSTSLSIDQNFFKAYPIKPLYGQLSDLFDGKQHIAISLSLAKKYFGNSNPVGKILIQNHGVNAPEETQIIAAVWDDQQFPSYFGMDVFQPDDVSVFGNELPEINFSTMLMFAQHTDVDLALQKMQDAYVVSMAKSISKNASAQFNPSVEKALHILRKKEGISSFKLVSEQIPNLNLGTFYETEAKQTIIYILWGLSAFLLLITAANYTNMSLVLAQERAKEVGVKKVLGAFRRNLVAQFFLEVCIQGLLALMLSLICAELLLPTVDKWIDADLLFFGNADFLEILWQLLAIVATIMLLAGLYPAMVQSQFKPAKVLKGNFATSVRVGRLRKVFIGIQFTVAVAIVIGFLVVNAQMDYMKSKDLGLQPEQLMSLTIKDFKHRNLSPAQFEGIKTRLKSIDGVIDVTRATEEPLNDSGFGNDITLGRVKLAAESRFVDPNYFDVLNSKFKSGRNFSYQTIATDSVQSVILNETAYRRLGVKTLNQQIGISDFDNKFNVVGVVKDIQAYGFEHKVEPTIYLLADYKFHWRRNIILRLNNQNITQTVNAIKTMWKTVEPSSIVTYNFTEEVFRKMNRTYEISQQIMFAFGLLTIFIAVFGLISIAAYHAKIRSKEIAIRRVLGASMMNLLSLVNRQFLVVVTVACLLADALAFFTMREWFTRFAYRITMPYHSFLLINMGILTIAILIISLQSLRTIKNNPATTLKYE